MFPVSKIMNRSAALLNDPNRTNFTYAKQLPYVEMALDELQEEFEQNNIPVTNEEASSLTIQPNVKRISFNTNPALPSNLVEIQQAWERLAGGSEPYVPLTKVTFLPHYLDGIEVDSLSYWAWEQQEMRFIGATTPREIKLDLVVSIFPQIITAETQITTINVKSFLSYRTAALCAEFIGENPSRAQSLNQDAVLAMGRALGIPVKGMQSISIRRRPFRASYKSRRY